VKKYVIIFYSIIAIQAYHICNSKIPNSFSINSSFLILSITKNDQAILLIMKRNNTNVVNILLYKNQNIKIYKYIIC